MADQNESRRQPWEYRTEEYPMEAADPLGMWLNTRGSEGWELVTLIHHVAGDHLYTAVFKRPKVLPPKPIERKGGKRK